ncbi:response regulator transcription factor [Neobacillus mesonae]|nr:response regulator transcription factor [Neobacillus mesonae]
MARILIVDDDAHIRELISLFLKREGLDIYEAADGEDALKLLDTVRPDLAVIDIMMPNMDGWELCSHLRAASDIPILMLTAKGETHDKVKGFGLGTDDYMVKPFAPQELVVRVKALLKRYRVSIDKSIKVGKITLDRLSFQVVTEQSHTTLPLKEFELLYKLASYSGITFSREQLIEDIWGMDYEGDERTVDVHVKRLRERFPEAEAGFRIVTIRGLGYRLEELA